MNEKCQIFTPYDKVVDLLDRLEYKRGLAGSKIIENACGDGNILIEVVRRYIEDGLSEQRSPESIRNGLQNDIYGVEIDKVHLMNCRMKLDEIAISYGITSVKWNLINKDVLKIKFPFKFDFIVGNPPYITYQELDIDTRRYLKENFVSCSEGKFDYCYAFIEASINSLDEKGRMVYLIPNSLFKNVFAKNLRNYMIEHIVKIYDYTSLKLFDRVLTSSAIIVIEKNSNSSVLNYYDEVAETNRRIIKKDLEDKWTFNGKFRNESHVYFGDYFKVSNSIATLLNRAFIIGDVEDTYKKIDELDSDILFPAASPRGLAHGKKEYIIFPYSYSVSGDLIRYSEEEFEEKFTLTYKYLSNMKSELLNRKSDISSKWFEYGRTQALSHLNQKKMLISSIVTKKVNLYMLDEKTIPYSGFYITPKKNFSLQLAREILESSDFLKHVDNVGINASGTSLRITVKDISNYSFDLNQYLDVRNQ